VPGPARHHADATQQRRDLAKTAQFSRADAAMVAAKTCTSSTAHRADARGEATSSTSHAADCTSAPWPTARTLA